MRKLSGLLAIALLGVAFPIEAVHASCKGKQVLVRDKTPLRKGPGLNYPVKSFLEKGRCVTLGEISADRAWALVEGGDLFGWVPTGRLDARGQKRVSQMALGPAPIGSGQKRGHLFTAQTTALFERPEASASQKKTLPVDARLLALSMTPDEAWVEVRDERNDTGWVPASAIKDPDGALALVPRADGGLSGVVAEAAPPAPPSEGARPEEPELPGRSPRTGATDLLVDVRVLLGAQLPSQALDSNGAVAYRRYDVDAFAGAAKVEARAAPLGPLEARLSYAFTLMAGLSPAANAAIAIGGRQHEARAVLGLPLFFSSGAVSPEIGYFMSSSELDTALPGAVEAQFLSTITHGASAGASAAFDVSSSVYVELEGGVLFGFSDEGPFDVGEPKLTLGGIGGAGLGIVVADSLDLMFRWDVRFRRTSFSGQSLTDPSITEATLTHFDNSLLAGVAFAL